MSIDNLGSMKECDHAEYSRIYDKYKDRLTVFSSYSGYSGGILGMPQMSTAWGIKGNETALIASECENWERRWEDPAAWTYWKNTDLVVALEVQAGLLDALEHQLAQWQLISNMVDTDNDEVVSATIEASMGLIGNAIRKARGMDRCPHCEGTGDTGGFDGWVLWQRQCPVCAGTCRFWPTQER